jgi:hypothetical protein
MLRKVGVLLAFAVTACASAPASSQMPAIAPGVRIGGVGVGGLTSEPARAKLEAEFSRSIPIVRGARRWWASPQRLGAGAAIDTAVSDALDARPAEQVGLDVVWSEGQIRKVVAAVSRSYDRKPIDAKLVGVGPKAPRIRKAKQGIAVRRVLLRRELELELSRGLREEIVLPTRTLRAKVTRKNFGPVIVITRGVNTLRLFSSTKLVRTFRVATGQARYPTPSGLFTIVVKELNPWWRPPNSDWARGLQPIPPGPGNPLGTRWMGLSAWGVGIHGTPDAASIGYSASHGCIRMQIPDAEWLFQHVDVGTPVAIV